MLRQLLESEPFNYLFRIVHCICMKYNIDCFMTTLAPRKPLSLDPIL